MRKLCHLCAAGVLVAAACHSQAQPSPGGSGCSIPQPPLESNKPNIFNLQQEQWLGDAQSNQQETDYDLLPQNDSAELESIGQKLLAQLPPTPVHYSFRVYESEDANGFSMAGGYVYIGRKLITDARSEDEVAGTLAHEIGHIYTHQVAIAITRQLKAMLGVNSVTTREDVENKMQLLWNAEWKYRAQLSEDEQEKDELIADRVGIFAMVRAGYAPRAFAENLDRVAANKGHTGNFFSDVLGATSEISMRVRSARKIASSLPEGCAKLEASSSPEFKAFQETVRRAPIHPLVAPSAGLASTALQPPMRPSLEQVRFSPDGKYILAQDETSIHVLSGSPLKHLFSIDAPGAQLANFTPDSSHVSFHYQTMRVESWDIVSAKRESYHELIDYEGCPQTSLSPDGRIFVCLSVTTGGVWLKLSDVETGKLFYDNKNFYLANYGAQAPEAISRFANEPGIGNVVYSQDGHVMLVITGTKVMAFDLVNRKPISLSKDLGHMVQGSTAFVDSDKLLFNCDWESKEGSTRDTFKMCEATFPDGLPLNNFKLGYQWVAPVTKGNHVLIGPFKDAAAMLVDPSNGKASAGFKLDSMDMFDQVMASENERGGVTVGELGAKQMQAVELPVSAMPRVEAAAFSPDGHYLAYSGKSRSSLWDLEARKRIGLMRPFRSIRIDEQDRMFAQYPPSQLKPGQNNRLDLATGEATDGTKFEIEAFQYSDVLVKFQPIEKTGTIRSNINLQITDPATGAQLWTKHFAHESPMVRQTDEDTLIFIWDLMSMTASDEMVHLGAKLVKTSDRKSEWVPQGLLVELVASQTGELRRAIAAPERYDGESSADRRGATLYGDYLVVRGNYNNSVIYRVSDGVRTGAFYGRAIAGDSKLGLIAGTNRDQEVIFYEAATGKELKRVTVDHLPRAARFIPAKNALLVLTASQRVYTIDLPATPHGESAAGK